MMEIGFLKGNKAIQPQQIQDQSAEVSKNENVASDKSKDLIVKNKVDTAELSGRHITHFDDKRITSAKSAMLYEMSVDADPARIEALSKSIAEGTYNIPSDMIAKAILG